MAADRSTIINETIVGLANAANAIIHRSVPVDRVVISLESLLLLIEEANGFEDFEAVHALIREAIDTLENTTFRRRGRPAFTINTSSIESLLSMNFRLTQIAKMLGVSVRTLHRRLSIAEISVSSVLTFFNFRLVFEQDLVMMLSGSGILHRSI